MPTSTHIKRIQGVESSHLSNPLKCIYERQDLTRWDSISPTKENFEKEVCQQRSLIHVRSSKRKGFTKRSNIKRPDRELRRKFPNVSILWHYFLALFFQNSCLPFFLSYVPCSKLDERLRAERDMTAL